MKPSRSLLAKPQTYIPSNSGQRNTNCMEGHTDTQNGLVISPSQGGQTQPLTTQPLIVYDEHFYSSLRGDYTNLDASNSMNHSETLGQVQPVLTEGQGSQASTSSSDRPQQNNSCSSDTARQNVINDCPQNDQQSGLTTDVQIDSNKNYQMSQSETSNVDSCAWSQQTTASDSIYNRDCIDCTPIRATTGTVGLEYSEPSVSYTVCSSEWIYEIVAALKKVDPRQADRAKEQIVYLQRYSKSLSKDYEEIVEALVRAKKLIREIRQSLNMYAMLD